MKFFFIVSLCIISLSLFSQTPGITNSQVCFGYVTTLSGNSSSHDSLISSWKWDLDNDGLFNDGSGKIITFTFPKADTNLVRLKIIRKNGDRDSLIHWKVIVNPLPLVNFQVDNLCATKPAKYVNKSAISTGSISQYLWDFNNDGVVDESGSSINYICGQQQIYETKLECVSNKGCSAFTTKATEVYAQPVAGFSAKNFCIGDTTLFTNATVLGAGVNAYFLWNFGDGKQELNPGNPKHVYFQDEAIPVARLIVVTDHNCRDTADFQIPAYALPTASLIYSRDTILQEGESIAISVNTSASEYLWSTGSTQASITVSGQGKYSVKLTDVKGCSTTLTAGIVVKHPGDTVNINNILTPNGDGINDYLIFTDLEFYEHCKLTIYNQWNVEVYSNRQYKNNWDGMRNNSPLDPGTYFYFLTADDKIYVKGSINILR